MDQKYIPNEGQACSFTMCFAPWVSCLVQLQYGNFIFWIGVGAWCIAVLTLIWTREEGTMVTTAAGSSTSCWICICWWQFVEWVITCLLDPQLCESLIAAC